MQVWPISGGRFGFAKAVTVHLARWLKKLSFPPLPRFTSPSPPSFTLPFRLLWYVLVQLQVDADSSAAKASKRPWNFGKRVRFRGERERAHVGILSEKGQ